MQAQGRAQSGFSLIELMVVIVLMVILTAMILPEMRGTFEDALLRSTGRKLVNAMNLAHSRAITFQQTHRLVLDETSERFVIERMAHEGESAKYVAVSDVPGGSGPLDKRIKVAVQKDDPGNLRMITFYANGTAESAEIVLRDREGFGVAVKVNGITGRVTTQELEHE